MAAALAPTLAATRGAMAQSREASDRRLLANYAVRVVENQAALVMKNWTPGTATGNFAADGHSQIRYTTTQSHDVADGGIPGGLMSVRTTVFRDANGNSSLDSGELRVTLRTKASKLLTYATANH